MTTGTSVAADMTLGIIDRFRSLPMFTSAVLIGHVVADLVRSALGLIVMVLVGLAVGFRPSAGAGGWAAAIAITLLVTFALSWVSAVIGMLGRSVEVVQQLGLVLFLPILASSAFVPTSSFPGPLRAFANDQPFTQAIEAVRALLLHQDPADHVWLALVWFLAITVAAFAARIVALPAALDQLRSAMRHAKCIRPNRRRSPSPSPQRKRLHLLRDADPQHQQA